MELHEQDNQIKNMIRSNLVEHANKTLSFESIELLTNNIFNCVTDVLEFINKNKKKR